MSIGSIQSRDLRNFGAAVGFQEDGPDKTSSAQKKAVILDPKATGIEIALDGAQVTKAETPSWFFGRTDANTTQPRLQFLKGVLDEFGILYGDNATVGELKDLAKGLPKGVRDAMKLEDYGTFFKHPLSDYRVTTVLRAITKEKSRLEVKHQADTIKAVADGGFTNRLELLVRSQCADRNDRFSAFSSEKDWSKFKNLTCDILDVYRQASGCKVSDKDFRALAGKINGMAMFESADLFARLEEFVMDVQKYATACDGFPKDGVKNLVSALSKAVTCCLDPQARTGILQRDRMAVMAELQSEAGRAKYGSQLETAFEVVNMHDDDCRIDDFVKWLDTPLAEAVCLKSETTETEGFINELVFGFAGGDYI